MLWIDLIWIEYDIIARLLQTFLNTPLNIVYILFDLLFSLNLSNLLLVPIPPWFL
jgi:hypothetical protein